MEPYANLKSYWSGASLAQQVARQSHKKLLVSSTSPIKGVSKI